MAHPKVSTGTQGDTRTVVADVRALLGHPVLVITCDGRVLVGILQAYDPVLNVVLGRCHERVFSVEKPVAAVQMGRVFLVRGDNVAVLAPLDEELDARIDYEHLCAEPILPVSH